MKQRQRMTECRVALFLSLAVSTASTGQSHLVRQYLSSHATRHNNTKQLHAAGSTVATGSNISHHRGTSQIRTHAVSAVAAASHGHHTRSDLWRVKGNETNKMSPATSKLAKDIHKTMKESSFWWKPIKAAQPSKPKSAEPMLLQKSRARLRRSRTRRGFSRHGDPHNVEDSHDIYGVPKIVWVILADVLAMAAFIGCIGVALRCTRQSKDSERAEDEQQLQYSASLAGQSTKEAYINRTPTFLKMPMPYNS